MRADDFVTGDSARGAGQSSLVGTETTNAVNTGLVGSATAIAKNMVIGGTELGDVDKMYQTGKSAIKGSVGAARVGSDLVKDTVDTAKKQRLRLLKQGLTARISIFPEQNHVPEVIWRRVRKKLPRKDFEPQSVPPSRIPNLRMWTTFIKKQKD